MILRKFPISQEKVKLSLCLNEHQEDVQGSGDVVPCILVLAIDGVVCFMP
jgi:hypothetical protein